MTSCCTNCGLDKKASPESFSVDRRNGELQARCRKCLNAQTKEWRNKNRDAARAAVRRWEKNNPEKLAAKSARRRGKKQPGRFTRLFGITLQRYEQMLAQQNGLCAICLVRMKPPCVDHCHLTNVVRGLLCRKCNTGIGQLNDSPALLRKALEYLETAKEPTTKTEPPKK